MIVEDSDVYSKTKKKHYSKKESEALISSELKDQWQNRDNLPYSDPQSPADRWDNRMFVIGAWLMWAAHKKPDFMPKDFATDFGQDKVMQYMVNQRE